MEAAHADQGTAGAYRWLEPGPDPASQASAEACGQGAVFLPKAPWAFLAEQGGFEAG